MLEIGLMLGVIVCLSAVVGARGEDLVIPGRRLCGRTQVLGPVPHTFHDASALSMKPGRLFLPRRSSPYEVRFVHCGRCGERGHAKMNHCKACDVRSNHIFQKTLILGKVVFPKWFHLLLAPGHKGKIGVGSSLGHFPLSSLGETQGATPGHQCASTRESRR